MNIVKVKFILSIINDLVNRTNKIVIYAYQFIKLYSIQLYENDQLLPIFDNEYI